MECVRENSLILLPEMFSCGFDYSRLEEAISFSEEVVDFMRELSEKKRTLLCGSIPVKEKGNVYNRAFLIQDGKVIGKRDKIKLFPLTDEDKHFSPGKENPVFDTKFGRVGILICFELRFSSLVQELRKGDAQIILVPAQWGEKRKEHLRILSRARAIESQSYLLLSDSWGESGGQVYAGCSAIYSPWGDILAFSEKGNSLLSADIDLKEVKKVRRYIPMD